MTSHGVLLICSGSLARYNMHAPLGTTFFHRSCFIKHTFSKQKTIWRYSAWSPLLSRSDRCHKNLRRPGISCYFTPFERDQTGNAAQQEYKKYNLIQHIFGTINTIGANAWIKMIAKSTVSMAPPGNLVQASSLQPSNQPRALDWCVTLPSVLYAYGN